MPICDLDEGESSTAGNAGQTLKLPEGELFL